MNVKFIKIIGGSGCMFSCGIVRGAIPARLLNMSENYRVDVKTSDCIFRDEFENTDMIILQRIGDPSLIPHIRKARWNHTTVIFDIDDALWNLPVSKTDISSKKFRICCDENSARELKEFVSNEVDLITCSTPELKEHVSSVIPNVPIHILPNFVDASYFHPMEGMKTPRKRILWYAANGHNYNAEFLVSVISELFKKRDDIDLQLIGCVNQFPALIPLQQYGNRIKVGEWISYHDLMYTINSCHVVLCPIQDHPFTRCKSEVKAIESCMCGVPCIMSKSPQYDRFARNVLSEEETKELVLINDASTWCNQIEKVVDEKIILPKLYQRTNAAYGAIRCIEAWSSLMGKYLP